MAQQNPGDNPREIVKNFLLEVRSGKYPDRAKNFMTDTVLAHQVVSENPVTVMRTPQNYADHIREFLEMFGRFDFEITELIAEGNKVYARWKQTGKHVTTIEGYEPTGLPLTDFGSAVYLVDKNKITEYWIQPDRQGLEIQLKQNAEKNKH